MTDFTTQYSAVLADLEERKASLKSRLDSLDATIAGLRTLSALPPPSKTPVVEQPVVEAPVNRIAVREQFTKPAVEIMRQVPVQGPSAAPERRRTTGLNVYVNQNSEWAARQMVAPSSPRSVFRPATGHRCPKCGSQDTRVSTTRGLSDIFMFLFEYSVGRCRNCDTRFRIWQAREEDAADDEFPEAAAATE